MKHSQSRIFFDHFRYQAVENESSFALFVELHGNSKHRFIEYNKVYRAKLCRNMQFIALI
jgi:hypothetical protein